MRAETLRLTNGTTSQYYALHVRRGDFQFKEVKLSATDIVKNLKVNEIIPRGAVVYLSTDDPKGECQGCVSQRKPCPKGEAARGVKGCLVDPSWDAFEKKAGWKVCAVCVFLMVCRHDTRAVVLRATPHHSTALPQLTVLCMYCSRITPHCATRRVLKHLRVHGVLRCLCTILQILKLGDFLEKGVLKNENPNYFGMVESIVCSRAEVSSFCCVTVLLVAPHAHSTMAPNSLNAV